VLVLVLFQKSTNVDGSGFCTLISFIHWILNGTKLKSKLDWIELNWTVLDWIGLNWIELD